MRVVMFVKYPEPGQVKTRLAADIGPNQAAALQTCFVHEELTMLHAAGADVILYCDPYYPLCAYRTLYGPRQRYALQSGDDLGQRMRRALNHELQEGPVLLIGSDLPDLPESQLRAAWLAVQHTDVCLGPALDGGFHLIGTSRPLPESVFRGVIWSEPDVLRDTISNLHRLDLSHCLLAFWSDVDTLPDLEAYVQRNRGRSTMTMQYLNQHV